MDSPRSRGIAESSMSPDCGIVCPNFNIQLKIINEIDDNTENCKILGVVGVPLFHDRKEDFL